MKMQELSQVVIGLMGHPLSALSAVNLPNVPRSEKLDFICFIAGICFSQRAPRTLR